MYIEFKHFVTSFHTFYCTFSTADTNSLLFWEVVNVYLLTLIQNAYVFSYKSLFLRKKNKHFNTIYTHTYQIHTWKYFFLLCFFFMFEYSKICMGIIGKCLLVDWNDILNVSALIRQTLCLIHFFLKFLHC